MTLDPAIEAVARALCRADGTAQCAAICLSHFASSTSDGKCPEALLVWKRKAEAPLLTAAPMIRAAALEEAAQRIEADGEDYLVRNEVAAAIRALKADALPPPDDSA